MQFSSMSVHLVSVYDNLNDLFFKYFNINVLIIFLEYMWEKTMLVKMA